MSTIISTERCLSATVDVVWMLKLREGRCILMLQPDMLPKGIAQLHITHVTHDSSSFEDDVLAVPDDNEMETMEETVLANEDGHL